jgi:hypothetical protein
VSYSTVDKSTQDGSPIELFEFIMPNETKRYTDADEIVVIGDDIYYPLPITRTAIEITQSFSNAITIDITVPASSELARAAAFIRSVDDLKIKIIRTHRGTDYATDRETIWDGYGTYFDANDDTVTVSSGTLIQAALSGDTNAVFYSKSCNHRLYDGRCKVIEADHTYSATILSFASNTITVNDDGTTDNALRAGQARNARTGERRFIISNVANVVTIAYAFSDVIEGDVVELIEGCNHSKQECRDKFSNIANYGGFLFIPTKNPFEGDI